jgi:site-specific recombinase XerD
VEEHFERFLADRWRDKPATIRDRRFWLRSFATFCQEQSLALERISPRDLKKYHEQLLWVPGPRGALSQHFIHQGLGMLRIFLRWAVQNGLLSPDPTVAWVLGRARSREKRLLTRAQLDAILNEPDHEPLGLRDCAILGVFAELGLSAPACQSLDLADLDLVHYRLHRKPISPQLAECFHHYLKRGRPGLLTNPDETALFVTQLGNRLSIQHLAQVPTRHAGQPVSISLLRRSWLAHREAFLGRRLTDS